MLNSRGTWLVWQVERFFCVLTRAADRPTVRLSQQRQSVLDDGAVKASQILGRLIWVRHLSTSAGHVVLISGAVWLAVGTPVKGGSHDCSSTFARGSKVWWRRGIAYQSLSRGGQAGLIGQARSEET